MARTIGGTYVGWCGEATSFAGVAVVTGAAGDDRGQLRVAASRRIADKPRDGKVERRQR
jgi:hypothetical protein